MQLADDFAASFFPYLTAPRLESLRLSAVGFTSATVPLIDNFLRSPHCSPLKFLTLNGNELGHEGVVQIIQTVREHNYCLTHFELFSNWHSDFSEWEQWKILLNDLRGALGRNGELAFETRTQALSLLRIARAALLRPCTTPRLPLELVLHIFSFVAPTASMAQRSRIISYATDPGTLPVVGGTQALFSLSDGLLVSILILIRDHLSLAEVWKQVWRSPYADMRATQERWIETVGCDVFDSEGRRVAPVLQSGKPMDGIGDLWIANPPVAP
jgi:hypothetical protein